MGTYKELNEILTDSKMKIVDDMAEVIFWKINAGDLEELNVKAMLYKQAFLNRFEYAFEREYLNAAEQLQPKYTTNSKSKEVN